MKLGSTHLKKFTVSFQPIRREIVSLIYNNRDKNIICVHCPQWICSIGVNLVLELTICPHGKLKKC